MVKWSTGRMDVLKKVAGQKDRKILPPMGLLERCGSLYREFDDCFIKPLKLRKRQKSIYSKAVLNKKIVSALDAKEMDQLFGGGTLFDQALCQLWCSNNLLSFPVGPSCFYMLFC